MGRGSACDPRTSADTDEAPLAEEGLVATLFSSVREDVPRAGPSDPCCVARTPRQRSMLDYPVCMGPNRGRGTKSDKNAVQTAGSTVKRRRARAPAQPRGERRRPSATSLQPSPALSNGRRVQRTSVNATPTIVPYARCATPLTSAYLVPSSASGSPAVEGCGVRRLGERCPHPRVHEAIYRGLMGESTAISAISPTPCDRDALGGPRYVPPDFDRRDRGSVVGAHGLRLTTSGNPRTPRWQGR